MADEGSFKQQVLLGEIAGKNAANHAYDRIVWAVRTGFLTVFFAGWGLLLTGILNDVQQDPTTVPRLALAFFLVSAGLALGALVVDVNYIYRKFLVIADLNELMRLAFQYGDEPDELKKKEQEILRYLVVSGDSGVGLLWRGNRGLWIALSVSATIYLLSIVIAFTAYRVVVS